MDLNRFIEFNTIADLGSFTKAAEQLGVSTAVLSVRFSKFEEQIGQRLFDRSSRSVTLTDAGQRFIADSRDIVGDYLAAIRLSQSAASDYQIELNVAVAGLTLPRRLAGIITEMRGKYRNLHISLSDDPVWSDILDGRVHLYVGCDDDPEDSRIRKVIFGRYRQFLLVPKGHRFAYRPEVPLTELTGEKLLLYPKTRLPGIRAAQERMLAHSGVTCSLVRESVAKGYYYDFVSMGMGVALLPFFAYPDNLPPNLTAVLLEPFSTRLNSYMYFLNDTYNPVLESVLHQLDRRGATMEDYGWGDADDN